MVEEGKRGESVSFVMRLWLEPLERGSGEWRWHVTHVQSGEQRYFRQLADVLQFVAEHAKVPPPPVSSLEEQGRR